MRIKQIYKKKIHSLLIFEQFHLEIWNLGYLIAHPCLFIKIIILNFATPVFLVEEEKVYKQNYFWNIYLYFKGLFLRIYKQFCILFVENCTTLIKSKNLNNFIINYTPIDRSRRDLPEYCKINTFLTLNTISYISYWT